MKNKNYIFLNKGECLSNKKNIIKKIIEATNEMKKGEHKTFVVPRTYGKPSTYIIKPLKEKIKAKVKTRIVKERDLYDYVIRVWKF